jgi:hypothetical protein
MYLFFHRWHRRIRSLNASIGGAQRYDGNAGLTSLSVSSFESESMA